MDRKEHIITHFRAKLCAGCHLPMLKIADNWYILHDETLCTNAKSSGNPTMTDTDMEFLQVQIKSEESNEFEYESIETNASGGEDSSEDPLEKASDNENSLSDETQLEDEPTTDASYARSNIDDSEEQQIHPKTMHSKDSTKAPIICTICNQTFSRAFSLTRHMNVHTKKRVECNLCGRHIAKTSLGEHLYRHKGIKPHKCELCPKTFARTGELTAHNRTHSGQKPYKCEIDQCDRAYSHGSDLKRHHFGAHGLYYKKYTCPLCERIYHENRFLKKHMRLAHPEVEAI